MKDMICELCGGILQETAPDRRECSRCGALRVGPPDPPPAPLVRIYRGLPGSGKSTLIERRWYEDQFNQQVFSADRFFLDDQGNYRFDPARLGEAHAWCFREFLAALVHASAAARAEDVLEVFTIDNTNVRAWEIAPYVQAANAHGRPHEVVTVLCDPLTAWRRNRHGVPLKAVWEMHRALLNESLPPHWNHVVVEAGGVEPSREGGDR